MDDTETTAVCAIIIGCALKNRRRRRERRVWCKEWLKKRDSNCLYTGLVHELKLADRGDYRRFIPMNSKTFEELLGKVRPQIEGQSTNIEGVDRVSN
eukprot:gene13455-14836_t